MYGKPPSVGLRSELHERNQISIYNSYHHLNFWPSTSLSNALTGLTVKSRMYAVLTIRRTSNFRGVNRCCPRKDQIKPDSSLSVSGTDIGRDEVADTDLRTSQVYGLVN